MKFKIFIIVLFFAGGIFYFTSFSDSLFGDEILEAETKTSGGLKKILVESPIAPTPLTDEKNADALNEDAFSESEHFGKKTDYDGVKKNGFICAMGPQMDSAVLNDELEAIFFDGWPVLMESRISKNKADPVIAGIVESGDTFGKLLEEAADGSAQPYVSALKKVFSPSSLKMGQPYIIITDPLSGKVKRFEYEINDLRRLVIEGTERPQARVENIKYTTVLEAVACIIEDNLFQSVADAGEQPQLAVRIAKIFGSEINFVKNLQDGDNFTVIVEKRYRNGQYRGYGRILAARFINKNRMYEAFLYADAAGNFHYYNGKGENLKKTLLQAPLAVTRLTSRFTHNRKHPILGVGRPHLGVDYGAPSGTPVKAVGDGIVVKRGWAGGYGNQIILQHSSGLESQYAHLSRYAKNLAVGQKVAQGQVIGYVGSTGLSTGPHLDFRLRQNGQYIDPAKAINPREAPVQAGRYEDFISMVTQERALLDGHRLPRNYTVETLLSPNVASAKKVNSRSASSEKKVKAAPVRRKNTRSISKKRS